MGVEYGQVNKYVKYGQPSLDLVFTGAKKSLNDRVGNVAVEFTRTQDTQASYVKSDGIIGYAATDVARFDHDPETGESLGLLIEGSSTNVIKSSQVFLVAGSGWSNEYGMIVTNNSITAPDNTLTGVKLEIGTTDSNQILKAAGINSTTASTYSIFAKAGSISTCIVGDGQIGAAAEFDLSNGTITLTNPSLYTGTITPSGNGWYRCSITNIPPRNSYNPSWFGIKWSTWGTGGVGDYIYLWGAQAEEGSYATSYIPTIPTFTSRASNATYYDQNGIVSTASTDVARDDAYFPDENGNFISAGLLLEEETTNLLIYSQQFDTGWFSSGILAFGSGSTANATTAPDGTTTADLITEDTSSANHDVLQYCDFTSGVTYTFSGFFKRASGTRDLEIIVGTISFPGYPFLTVSGATGEVLSSTDPNAKSEAFPGGWYRVSFSATADATGNTPLYYRMVDNGSDNYTGDGTSGLYLWGAQVEEGSYATSYIPTAAGISTRAADISSSGISTRGADTAQITGTNFSSWYNQSEGTTLVHMRNIKSDDFSQAPFIGYNGQNSIWDNLKEYGLRYNSSGTTFEAVVRDVSAGFVSLQRSGDVRSESKAVIALSDTQFAYTRDGLSVQTGATSGPMSTITELLWHINGDPKQSSHFARLTYWPKRLPDSDLQSLTE